MEAVVGTASMPGDPRFFRRTGPHTLAAVADAAEAEAPPRRLMLHRIAPLAVATAEEVTFCVNNRKLAAALRASGAGAVIVHPDMRDAVPETAVAIVADDPMAAWAKVAALFHPAPPVTASVHPSAIVAATARVHDTAEVGAMAVIGEHAVIGARCRIGIQAVVGDGVVMGSDVRIGTHVSVSHALLGDRVCLYPGARVGQDGFGFAITSSGFLSVPQVGRVVIGDDVEIGSNTTVDRGALEDTVIGAGTRIDNLVQIAHNCRIGRACVLTGQVGLAGSVILEDFVVLGGQAGIAGHVRIAKGVRVGAKGGVMTDITQRGDYLGAPVQPAKAFFREVAMIRKWVKAGLPPGSRGGHGDKSSDKNHQDVD
ncbi:MAG: UDP-3-O-(3-hydroxymyristoyl)glucosamine N-acyltransferase [Acetobacteraceae bacterium]|nr:UDP-3-O-(3-hydroxymyristoyl)glucosamine N-acyltransferase [Pseudomonadota bacterium]